MLDREPSAVAGLLSRPCGVWVHRRVFVSGLPWWAPLAGASRRSVGLAGMGCKPMSTPLGPRARH